MVTAGTLLAGARLWPHSASGRTLLYRTGPQPLLSALTLTLTLTLALTPTLTCTLPLALALTLALIVLPLSSLSTSPLLSP